MHYHMNSIRELVLKIKERPAMYLGCNSISCLKAFIDGWYFRDMETVSDVHIMGNFHDWIEERLIKAGTQGWHRIILFYSQDECDALKTFFKLFDEFLEDEANLIKKPEA